MACAMLYPEGCWRRLGWTGTFFFRMAVPVLGGVLALGIAAAWAGEPSVHEVQKELERERAGGFVLPHGRPLDSASVWRLVTAVSKSFFAYDLNVGAIGPIRRVDASPERWRFVWRRQFFDTDINEMIFLARPPGQGIGERVAAIQHCHSTINDLSLDATYMRDAGNAIVANQVVLRYAVPEKLPRHALSSWFYPSMALTIPDGLDEDGDPDEQPDYRYSAVLTEDGLVCVTVDHGLPGAEIFRYDPNRDFLPVEHRLFNSDRKLFQLYRFSDFRRRPGGKWFPGEWRIYTFDPSEKGDDSAMVYWVEGADFEYPRALTHISVDPDFVVYDQISAISYTRNDSDIEAPPPTAALRPSGAPWLSGLADPVQDPSRSVGRLSLPNAQPSDDAGMSAASGDARTPRVGPLIDRDEELRQIAGRWGGDMPGPTASDPWKWIGFVVALSLAGWIAGKCLRRRGAER